MHESSVMGATERVSCAQVKTSADTRGEYRARQAESNSIANGADLRTTLSSPRSRDQDCLIVSPIFNKFQVLRDLKENYPCSDGELPCCDQPMSPSVVTESSLEMVTPTHSSYQKNPQKLFVYTRRKKRGKDMAEAEFSLAAPVSEVPREPISFANASFAMQTGSFGNLGEGSFWVINHILEFCEKMGL